MAIKRDMAAFRYASLLSIGGLLYTGIVMFIELYFYVKQNYNDAEIVPAYIDMNIFTGFSMTFYSFTCQTQLLPIYSELVNPNYRRIVKVINRSVFVNYSFYVSIASAGYFS